MSEERQVEVKPVKVEEERVVCEITLRTSKYVSTGVYTLHEATAIYEGLKKILEKYDAKEKG